MPQETFYRRPKVLAQNECRALEMGQYRAGDGKTYSIARNVRTEINYFARGSAKAYSGFYSSQITCTGGKLLVDGLEVDNMVMYVTEELLYRDEKFITRKTMAELLHITIMSGLPALWRILTASEEMLLTSGVPLKAHCPLYHVPIFKGQIIKYDSPGLTNKPHKMVISTDNSHMRFVIKGTKTECGQEFFVDSHSF